MSWLNETYANLVRRSPKTFSAKYPPDVDSLTYITDKDISPRNSMPAHNKSREICHMDDSLHDRQTEIYATTAIF